MIDVAAVRADIPAVADLIHFNNAGMSLMPQPVFRSMLEYLYREQEIGGYETAAEREHDTGNFYQQAATLINATPAEIAFCESASKAWQHFFYSLQLQPGDHVITTQLDYGSHFVSLIQQRNEHGVSFSVVGTDANGDIDLEQMAAAFTSRTRLVSMSHIPTANGIINPAARVGQLARDHQVPFLLDACQSVGQIEVDVKAIGCTALSVTGRKYLRGPRGTGFLYVNHDALSKFKPAWLEQNSVELDSAEQYQLRSDAKRFENFEVGFAGRVALGKAIEYANRLGMSDIERRIVELGSHCRHQLARVPGVSIADRGQVQGGIVMFTVENRSPREVCAFLKQHQIQVWASSGPGSLIDYQQRGLTSLVRASLHYFNTTEEIDRMVELLRDAA